ncbi:MAG TPA: glycosyltransferase, partial [Planctomycetota bacterium]|nr:glycosyltransferase [Planctomycetota bacterium]
AVWSAMMDADDRLGLVVLARNFGKEPALMAGLAHATGDVVIPMDADLQDPPEVIAHFLEQWRAGYDTVYGVRRCRRDPLWKRVSARAYYWVLKRLSCLQILENAGDFRLLDRSVVDRLLALPEVDRYTRGLYQWVGGRTIGVPYDRPARAGDERRYRLTASIDQAIAGLSFTDVPLQASFVLGLSVSAAALLYLVYCLVCHLCGVPMAWGWASLISLVSFLGGVQLISVGVLGLYLGRVFREVKRRPAFLIAEALGAVRSPEVSTDLLVRSAR